MMESKYERLWQADSTTVDLIIECGERVSKAYEQQAKCKRPSQTLLTKILLGVFGCVPAYDRYFISGLKKYGLTATYGKRSLLEIFKFYNQNSEAFEDMKKIIARNGTEYTSMKLSDMFFWEEGVKLTNKTHEDAFADGDE